MIVAGLAACGTLQQWLSVCMYGYVNMYGYVCMAGMYIWLYMCPRMRLKYRLHAL